ncbi:hypothetical protein DFH06DRAFT_1348845 [Mycena polygramma]|nr:hypothetical protein DFH06DRAFT_1348845 [Mycena polygramma]
MEDRWRVGPIKEGGSIPIRSAPADPYSSLSSPPLPPAGPRCLTLGISRPSSASTLPPSPIHTARPHPAEGKHQVLHADQQPPCTDSTLEPCSLLPLANLAARNSTSASVPLRSRVIALTAAFVLPIAATSDSNPIYTTVSTFFGVSATATNACHHHRNCNRRRRPRSSFQARARLACFSDFRFHPRTSTTYNALTSSATEPGQPAPDAPPPLSAARRITRQRRGKDAEGALEWEIHGAFSCLISIPLRPFSPRRALPPTSSLTF